jgi:ribosome-associated protein
MTGPKDALTPALRAAIEAAQEKQASDITLLSLAGLGAFTDHFLICTGFSTPQLEAISDEIERRVERLHIRRVHREGSSGAEWVLLDFGSFIVHVFSERARHYYDLERLWRAAKRTDIHSSDDERLAAEAEG